MNRQINLVFDPNDEDDLLNKDTGSTMLTGIVVSRDMIGYYADKLDSAILNILINNLENK